jgi:hypothetical protein
MGGTIRIPDHVELGTEKSLPLDASDITPTDHATRLEYVREEISRVRKIIRDVGRENGIIDESDFIRRKNKK